MAPNEEFKSVEKFNVRLLSEDGPGSERVSCQIGLDGLAFVSHDSGRTLRKYPLNHISRWAARGTSLVLYTKTPVDVEERTVTLQSDEGTIRSVLDTLTCCCMQMCELLNSNEGGSAPRASGGTSNPYTQMLNHGKKKAAIPTADEVEYWKDPEKTGWMLSQGEHIKTWRRRWFVLKQGFLYRFSSPDVSSSTKPRGVVDLSKVTDVKDGRVETGKPNSLKLATSTGKVCYITDSETELVEWMSALEGAVNKIVKRVAGVEDEAPAPSSRSAAGAGSSSGRGGNSSWSTQLERSFSAASGGTGAGGTGAGGSSFSADRGTAKVTIVGYEGGSSGLGASSGAGGGMDDYGDYGGTLNYGSITGLAGVVNQPAEPQPLVNVDYGSYPVPSFAPAAPAPGAATGAYPGLADASGGSYRAPGNAHYMEQLTQLGHAHQAQQPQQPSYLDAVPGAMPAQPQQAPPQQASNGQWQVHYTADGRAYYHNAATGVTTWEAPAGMA